MENVTQVIETTQSQTSSSEVKHSIGELLSHVRGLWLNPGNRISRGEYLLAAIPFSVISGLIGLLLYKTIGMTSVYGIYTGIIAVVGLVMGIRLSNARFHDNDKSGRNFLRVFTIIGAFYVIYMNWFKKGTVGDNKYGHDPLTKQFSDNTNYLIIGILGAVISGAISAFGPNSQSMMIQNGMNLQNSEYNTLSGDIYMNSGYFDPYGNK